MTLAFRNQTPKRDPNRAVCEHYTSYRKTLRQDFNKRCGYCDSFDHYRIKSFAIDHFIPRNPKDFIPKIAPNVYKNLVWSCSYCNLAKSNKWPTKDETISNDGNVGFIDPELKEYSELFKRNADGEIQSKNNKAIEKHIIKELKLWLPIHSRMWKLEKLMKLELDLRNELSLITDDELRKDFKDCHYDIMMLVIDLMRNIFSEND